MTPYYPSQPSRIPFVNEGNEGCGCSDFDMYFSPLGDPTTESLPNLCTCTNGVRRYLDNGFAEAFQTLNFEFHNIAEDGIRI